MTQLQRTRLVLRGASLVLSLYCLWGIGGYVLAGNVYLQSIPFVVAFVAVTVACLAAWRWGREGGLAVIICGGLLGLASAYSIAAAAAQQGTPMPIQTLAGLVWALPYVIFGVLFRALAERQNQAV